MNMVEIEHALRELRLSGMQQTLTTRAMQAQTSPDGAPLQALGTE